MQEQANYICPDWPAPDHIKAYTSTRVNGHSKAPFDSFNLALHVQDDPKTVGKNRQQLVTELALPHEPIWLEQVHGTAVISINSSLKGALTADAAVAHEPNRVCTVLTADCLPVLLCDVDGKAVAAIHAGWRGLLAGVIDATVEALSIPPENILAWLGPAIGPEAFEINEEIRYLYIDRDKNNVSAFHKRNNSWYGDLYELARINLSRFDITRVSGGNLCTYHDKQQFFSYRRAKGPTGRMATMIWIEGQ